MIGGCNNGGTNGSRMLFTNMGCNGGPSSVFVEGLAITEGTVEDVINVSAAGACTPDVYLQNIWVTGAQGQLASNHTDVYQGTGGTINSINVFKFTYDTNYQGITLTAGFNFLSANLGYVNGKYNAITPQDPVTYAIWLRDTDSLSGGCTANPLCNTNPVNMYQVYLAPRSAQTIACCGVWPPTGETQNGIVVGAISDAFGNVTFPSGSGMFGEIFTGAPPGGDFVVPGGTGPGVGYISPGYQNFLLKRDIYPASNDNSPMWLEKAA